VSGPALVTGGAGFAGSHLLELLDSPVAPDRDELELLDAEAVRRFMAEVRPAAVYHLAALASVGRSWSAPGETLVRNLEMTVNVLEAVRLEAPEARVLVAGSGEVYGPPAQLPVGEDAPLRPQNPYAVSKAACDLLAGQYADAHGLRVVRTRAFNHVGPGQGDDYVFATICRQVAEAEAAGRDEAVLRLGNVDAARDFTDVRDVVRAYTLAPEGVFNVCSGRATTIGELVELVARAARIPVRIEIDPERMRPSDVPEVRGSAERLREATGWRPDVALERTAADTLDWWRERVSRAPAPRGG
jgi:GDP-4-dehydro-6-deoxy-D-mannose reductase